MVWGLFASDVDLSRYPWIARLGIRLEARLSSLADLVICNSNRGIEHARASGFRRDRLTVVPTGFDTERFAPDPEARRRLRAEWRIPEGDLLVGRVGRLDPMKDYPTFLRAASLLSAQRPDIRFVWVGDGHEALASEFQRQRRDLGLDARLSWLGARNDMPQVYSALDVLCSSSAFGEGLPNVLGEAMSCGIPCVTTAVGDSALIVGETGVVVPPADPASLARGIGLLLEETSDGRQTRGRRARQRIQDRFSVQAMVDSTVSSLKNECSFPARHRHEARARRVTLTIASLGGGGAERVLSRMAGYWARKGWPVTVITLSGTGSDAYALNAGVRRIALALDRPSGSPTDALRNNLRRIFHLRNAIRESKPEVIISFINEMNVLTLLASRFMGIPVIVSERTDPRVTPLGRTWDRLRSQTYRMASALVIQTRASMEWANARVGRNRVSVIPNPVEGDPASSPESTESPRPFIVAMGRLAQQKGFHLLLPAFQKIARRFPDWSLVILGEGSERASLEAMVTALGLGDRVRLEGRKADPLPVLRQASMFVLSSLYEGFPNALVEAMACGLPCVSFECESGPREILRHGVDGLLVPPGDIEALSQAMAELAASPEKRQQLGSQARSIADRFSEDRIMREWEDLVVRLTSNAGRNAPGSLPPP
jgi:glycosyltransferase involved in cell wall biosynthesis